MIQLRSTSFILSVIIFSSLLFGCNTNSASVQTTTSQSAASLETTSCIAETEISETIPANTRTFILDGITLTLPEDFEEIHELQWPQFYNGYSFVTVVREPFSAHPSLKEMSLDEYCPALIESKNLDATVRVQRDLHWFDYTTDIPDSGRELYHFVVVYKTNSDFWIVEFMCDARTGVRARTYFAMWAKWIEFTN